MTKVLIILACLSFNVDKPDKFISVARDAMKIVHDVDVKSATNVLTETEKLSPVMEILLEVKSVKNISQPNMEVKGIIELKHINNRTRYQTEDERKLIKEYNDQLDELSYKYRQKVLEIKREYRSGSPTQKDKLHKAKTEYEKNKNDLESKRNSAIDSMKLALERRRAFCEDIEATILFDEDLASKVDVEAFMKKKKIRMLIKVKSFELQKEPEEVDDAGICIKSIEMQCVALHKSVRKPD